MCGIAGIMRKDGGAVDAAQLQAMSRAVAHRGPDGEGVHLDGALGLGHRRLAILDISPQGAQPMQDSAGRYTIVHNGEVYNYRELREELRALGYHFGSETDTEVILAAYAAWGEACVERFNGMWAFAIYDAQTRTLFCSRDRFGVKPFYYVDDATRFAFGSEIRQLLPLLSATHAHLPTVITFLATAAADLGEETFFASVKRLLPGHSLRLRVGDAAPHIWAHYQLQRPAALSPSQDDAAAAAQLRALLEDAVRLRLRSDVTVGTCLSGGLDSSSVATLAAGLSAPGSFAAITAVSEQESNNEEAFAQQVAAHAGLQWHRVKPSYADFVASLPAVVRTQEEPFGSASIVMQYWVMQTARAQVIPVLLDGQGGDELLLGYERYYATALLSMLRREGLLATLRSLRAIRRNNSKMHARAIAKYLLGAASAWVRYGYYKRQHRYLKNLPAQMPHLQAMAHAVADMWGLQALDITRTNLPILLRYEDKNAMAHAVEARLPFLDYRVVEYALAQPITRKIRDGWSKWLLRAAMDGRMPDAITWRKHKFGFEAPEQLWLTQHAEAMRRSVFASPLIHSISDMDMLARCYPALDARSQFRLYSVALWAEAFSVSAPPAAQ